MGFAGQALAWAYAAAVSSVLITASVWSHAHEMLGYLGAPLDGLASFAGSIHDDVLSEQWFEDWPTPLRVLAPLGAAYFALRQPAHRLGWHSELALQQQTEVNSTYPPSILLVKNRLYVAYVLHGFIAFRLLHLTGAGTSATTVFTTVVSTEVATATDVSMTVSPVNSVYMAFADSSQNVIIAHSFDGFDWHLLNTVSPGTSTHLPPCAIEFNDRLSIAWTAPDGFIQLVHTTSPAPRVTRFTFEVEMHSATGLRSKYGPRLNVVRGRLVLLWVPAAMEGSSYIAVSGDGLHFGPPQPIPVPIAGVPHLSSRPGRGSLLTWIAASSGICWLRVKHTEGALADETCLAYAEVKAELEAKEMIRARLLAPKKASQAGGAGAMVDCEGLTQDECREAVEQADLAPPPLQPEDVSQPEQQSQHEPPSAHEVEARLYRWREDASALEVYRRVLFTHSKACAERQKIVTQVLHLSDLQPHCALTTNATGPSATGAVSDTGVLMSFLGDSGMPQLHHVNDLEHWPRRFFYHLLRLFAGYSPLAA